jgi:hypothetical protein
MVNGTLSVGTTAVQVVVGAAQTPVIVNVGTTTLYFGNTDEVTTANGLPIGPNVGYEFPSDLVFSGWDELWVISDGEGGELRYATVG